MVTPLPSVGPQPRSTRSSPRVRRLAAVAIAGLLAAGAPAAAVGATANTSPASAERRAAPFATVFSYTFDNGESLAPGTRVRDASGRGHHGTVLVEAGGRLTLERHAGEGRAAGYPSRCKGCGRAIIQMNKGKGLNPTKNAFRFGVAVRLRPAQVSKNANLVQKGFANQTGGQYKLQVDNGRPSCVVTGSAGSVEVISPLSLADGSWHSLSCQRVGKEVVLRVDGALAGVPGVGTIGTVRNGAPVRVGGSKIGPGNSQYRGDLDNVFLKIRR